MLSAKSALVNQSIHVYVYVLVKKRKLLIILFYSIRILYFFPSFLAQPAGKLVNATSGAPHSYDLIDAMRTNATRTTVNATFPRTMDHCTLP